MDERRGNWIAGLLTGLLFWIMFAAGAASLGAALLIPAWLEYENTLQQRDASAQRNEDLARARLLRENQLAHHRKDDFYNARYAERELNLRTPYYEWRYRVDEESEDGTIQPDPTAASTTLDTLPTSQLRQPEGLLALFVLPQTRPAVLTLSSILVAGSLILLSGRPGWAPARQ